jgi:hypothetical protein
VPVKGAQALGNKTKALIFVLALALNSSNAVCSEWRSFPQNDKSALVTVGTKADDGGMLVVSCNTTTKAISIELIEPRAHWQAGTPVSWTVKADAGADFVPSTGIAIGPTQIIVKAPSMLDIRVMGAAKTFFIVNVGYYSRIFTVANFKKEIDSVLRACGDHW